MQFAKKDRPPLPILPLDDAAEAKLVETAVMNCRPLMQHFTPSDSYIDQWLDKAAKTLHVEYPNRPTRERLRAVVRKALEQV